MDGFVERRRASVAAAGAMGLREGDEVAVGGRAYAVARISDDGVWGEPTAESGRFVGSATLAELDMRLPGWVRLPGRAASGGETLRAAALVRLVGILQFNGSHLRTPYEALARVLRVMCGVAMLPREQITEVLSLPERERAGLAVAAFVEPGGLTLVLGDQSAATAPISAFGPSACAPPDFGRLALADHGNTVRLGEYEADVGFVLRAARAGEGEGAPSKGEAQ